MVIYGFWILLSIGIGVWASRWGRNGFGWAVTSLMISPMIAAIVLLIAGNNVKKEFHIVTNADGSQTVTEHRIEKPEWREDDEGASQRTWAMIGAIALFFVTMAYFAS